MRLFPFRRRQSDRGATDPILVIAAIAVSLVLLVGGSFTVSGVIANAKNANAKNDLALIATAEAATQADGSSYLAWGITAAGVVSGDTNLNGDRLDKSKVGFTTTPGVAINVNANTDGWVAAATSSTGAKFFRSSKQSTIFTGSIPASAYAAGLTDPSSPAPYNAAVECPPLPYDTYTAQVYTDQYAGAVIAATASTLTIRVNLTGSALCQWAVAANLNLAGDSVVSNRMTDTGKYSAHYLDHNYATQDLNATGMRVDIVAAGTALSAQRTVTITVNLANVAPAASASELAYDADNYNSFFEFVSPRTGKTFTFSHDGQFMLY
ncbi:hypothetical protein [Curtobacterium sp. MCSS17_016]|uniref:hypothetical protein n=1 Tax=Curtobacterium sp. MCSS17_016 TaxID=2175644 RepID=UPI000DA9CEA2|nr:hypothetical protein [Curtobacterium sp. MCSS17_016]WIE81346.1 hypothetical protein DEJ19_019115 [Curtobacterium sp. MCSS17_016]